MADTPRKAKTNTVDLPPTGARNPDPITDAAAAHPIEAGVGAAVGGASAGFAAGVAAGPAGAVAGGVAGGYAGKGIGELIDPTTEEAWYTDYYRTHHVAGKMEALDTFRPAFHYGVESGTRHPGKRFEELEPDLRSEWDKARGTCALNWDQARSAVRNAYYRTTTRKRG